jgi:hypothetical protein
VKVFVVAYRQKTLAVVISTNKLNAERLVLAENKWIIEPNELETEQVAYGAEGTSRILLSTGHAVKPQQAISKTRTARRKQPMN